MFACFKGLLAGGKTRRAERDKRKASEDFDAEEAEAMEVCLACYAAMSGVDQAVPELVTVVIEVVAFGCRLQPVCGEVMPCALNWMLDDIEEESEPANQLSFVLVQTALHVKTASNCCVRALQRCSNGAGSAQYAVLRE